MSDSAVFEILAQFELVIAHEFTPDELTDADSDLATVLENFEHQVQLIFSESSIDIQLDNDFNLNPQPSSNFNSTPISKINPQHQYQFVGSVQRCYLFDAKDFDGDQLIDGSFDELLTDMQQEVLNVCEMSGYQTRLISFSWADDELVEPVTE